MLRLFSILVILVIVDSSYGIIHFRRHHHRGGKCRHHIETIEEQIKDIGEKYSYAESTYRRFCMENATVKPKIMYGEENYIITYELADVENVDDLTVNITAQNQQIFVDVQEAGNFKGFKDTRILPEILDLKEGVWWFMNKNLKIMLPYKVPLGVEFVSECPPENTIINIVKGKDVSFQLRSNLQQVA